MLCVVFPSVVVSQNYNSQTLNSIHSLPNTSFKYIVYLERYELNVNVMNFLAQI